MMLSMQLGFEIAKAWKPGSPKRMTNPVRVRKITGVEKADRSIAKAIRVLSAALASSHIRDIISVVYDNTVTSLFLNRLHSETGEPVGRAPLRESR